MTTGVTLDSKGHGAKILPSILYLPYDPRISIPMHIVRRHTITFKCNNFIFYIQWGDRNNFYCSTTYIEKNTRSYKKPTDLILGKSVTHKIDTVMK